MTLVRDATAAFAMDRHRATTEQTGPLWADAVLSTEDVLSAIRRNPGPEAASGSALSCADADRAGIVAVQGV